MLVFYSASFQALTYTFLRSLVYVFTFAHTFLCMCSLLVFTLNIPWLTFIRFYVRARTFLRTCSLWGLSVLYLLLPPFHRWCVCVFFCSSSFYKRSGSQQQGGLFRRQDLLSPSFEGDMPSDFPSRGCFSRHRVVYSVGYLPSAGFLPHGRPGLLSPSFGGDMPLHYPSRGYVLRHLF